MSNHPIFNNLSLQTIASARTILAIIFWYLYNSILFIYMLFAIAYSLAPTIICSKLSTTIIATQETFCGQTIMTPVGWIFFGISIIIFFINHLISYNVNFNVEVQRSETISRLLFMPYLRFIPVQIILVIGGLYFKSSVVIFLILKTIIDIYTHNYIHKIGSNTEERQQESKNLTNLKSAPVIIIILAILFCPIFFLLCTFFLPLFTPIFFIAIILLYKKKREY